MLKNFFKTTVRTLLRNKTYSFLNIFGLAVGIAASILILLWVQDELTFNHYFSNYRDLYQIKQNTTTDNGVVTRQYTPLPLRESLAQPAHVTEVVLHPPS